MAELPDVGTIKSFQSKLDAVPKRSPDVGSIEPLTEYEARKTFGTPLQRLLKIDPISVQRDPIKRGIASIGSNILDMLNPVATFEEGLKEGSPAKMGLGGLDLILGSNPYIVMFKIGTKPVRELAKKLRNMSPKEVDFHRQKIDDFIETEKGKLEFKRGYQSTEGRKLPGADKVDGQIFALEKNREILFKEAGVDYKKRLANFADEEIDPVELQTGFSTLQEYMEDIARNPGPIPFDPNLKKQIIKYIKDNPQKVESIALRKKLQRTDLDDAIDSLD